MAKLGSTGSGQKESNLGTGADDHPSPTFSQVPHAFTSEDTNTLEMAGMAYLRLPSGISLVG